MHIKKFTHKAIYGQNRELFGLIGEFCACPATRDALGGMISSRPGQVWYVALQGPTVYAFGSIRIRGASGVLRHLYSPLNHNEAWEAVLRHCIEHARRSNVRLIRLTDYLAMESRYAQLGFVPSGAPRGRVMQYALQLEPTYVYITEPVS